MGPDGMRHGNEEARSKTQSNFGGTDDNQERNAYDMLMEMFRGYSALRSLDKMEKNDPINPGNFDLPE